MDGDACLSRRERMLGLIIDSFFSGGIKKLEEVFIGDRKSANLSKSLLVGLFNRLELFIPEYIQEENNMDDVLSHASGKQDLVKKDGTLLKFYKGKNPFSDCCREWEGGFPKTFQDHFEYFEDRYILACPMKTRRKNPLRNKVYLCLASTARYFAGLNDNAVYHAPRPECVDLICGFLMEVNPADLAKVSRAINMKRDELLEQLPLETTHEEIYTKDSLSVLVEKRDFYFVLAKFCSPTNVYVTKITEDQPSFVNIYELFCVCPEIAIPRGHSSYKNLMDLEISRAVYLVWTRIKKICAGEHSIPECFQEELGMRIFDIDELLQPVLREMHTLVMEGKIFIDEVDPFGNYSFVPSRELVMFMKMARIIRFIIPKLISFNRYKEYAVPCLTCREHDYINEEHHSGRLDYTIHLLDTIVDSFRVVS